MISTPTDPDFNPKLVRFKQERAQVKARVLANFNPKLVRFKLGLGDNVGIVLSHFNPKLVRFKPGSPLSQSVSRSEFQS